MKFIWLILGLVCFVGILILFFQLVTYGNYSMPFFTVFIDIKIFTIYLLLLAFLSGMFITLALKGFMSGSNTIDDDFNL